MKVHTSEALQALALPGTVTMGIYTCDHRHLFRIRRAKPPNRRCPRAVHCSKRSNSGPLRSCVPWQHQSPGSPGSANFSHRLWCKAPESFQAFSADGIPNKDLRKRLAGPILGLDVGVKAWLKTRRVYEFTGFIGWFTMICS